MKRFWPLFAAAVTLAATTAAGSADECAGAKTQLQLTECYDGIYRRADAELNAVYHHLAGNLAAEERTKEYAALLEAAERAWITFRDKECEFETAVTRGGTIHPMEFAICLARLTRARSSELKRQLACPEGDISCVR